MIRSTTSEPESESVQRVLSFLDHWWEAYESGSLRFFDRFAEDATFFSPGHATRIDGVKPYKEFFGPHFGARRRALQALDPEIRLLADGAFVSYHVRIRVNYQCADHRTTLLLIDEGGNLKIAHMHMSPLASPQPDPRFHLIEQTLGLLEEDSTS